MNLNLNSTNYKPHLASQDNKRVKEIEKETDRKLIQEHNCNVCACVSDDETNTLANTFP